jgi:hypothetical protein
MFSHVRINYKKGQHGAALLSLHYELIHWVVVFARTVNSVPMSPARPSSVNEPPTTRVGTGQSRPTSTSRPWTAQSRPGTARPQTAASTMHEASYIIALIESRGIAHEVGMAAIDKETGRVMLIQVKFIPDIAGQINSVLNSLRTALRMLRPCTRCTSTLPLGSLCLIRFYPRRTRTWLRLLSEVL